MCVTGKHYTISYGDSEIMHLHLNNAIVLTITINIFRVVI